MEVLIVLFWILFAAYLVGIPIWFGCYVSASRDRYSRVSSEYYAHRALCAPIWPLMAMFSALQMFQKLRRVAKGEENW